MSRTVLITGCSSGIGAALVTIDSEAGQLDMLVNNAGYSQVGAAACSW